MEQELKYPFKEIAKVGKNVIRTISGLVTYKDVQSVEEIDFDSCPIVCPMKNVSLEEKADYCLNHCPFADTRKTIPVEKPIYVNEYNRYKINNKQVQEHGRFSKNLGLLYLALHFCQVDKQGFIKYVPEQALSELLDCNIRTVRANLKKLNELKLISMSKITSELVAIHITGYESYHLSKEEKGTGYLQYPLEALHKLIELKDVNAMRVSLRVQLEFDNHFEKENNRVQITYKKAQEYLPSNMKYKKAIDSLLDKCEPIFTTAKGRTYFYAEVRPDCDGKIQKVEKEKYFGEELSTFIAEISDSTVTAGEMENLIQLSFEYGIDYVKQGYENAIEYTMATDEVIENLGAFVRRCIVTLIQTYSLGYEPALASKIFREDLRVA